MTVTFLQRVVAAMKGFLSTCSTQKTSSGKSVGVRMEKLSLKYGLFLIYST